MVAMKDILHLLADGLVAAGTALSRRTRGFSEIEAERYLHSVNVASGFAGQRAGQSAAFGPYIHPEMMSSAAAGGVAAASAATHVGHPPVDAGRAPDERTSELLLAGANMACVLLRHTHFDHLRETYLEELIPAMRERACFLASQGF